MDHDQLALVHRFDLDNQEQDLDLGNDQVQFPVVGHFRRAMVAQDEAVVRERMQERQGEVADQGLVAQGEVLELAVAQAHQVVLVVAAPVRLEVHLVVAVKVVKQIANRNLGRRVEKR